MLPRLNHPRAPGFPSLSLVALPLLFCGEFLNYFILLFDGVTTLSYLGAAEALGAGERGRRKEPRGTPACAQVVGASGQTGA